MKETRVDQNETKKSSAWALSATEFGDKLGVSPRHIWRLHATGKLPKPIRLGKSVRWLVNEINEWLEAGAPDRRTWEAMKEIKKR